MSRLLSTNINTNNPTGDAFGRLRTSNPETLFDSKQIFDNAPNFWDDAEQSGGSTTSTHSADTASTTLGVALNTAGNRVRQTYQSFNYQPGKSQLIFMTFVLDESGGGTGITRYVGQFNSDNGLFLKDDEGTYKFVRRTHVTGSPVDNEVAQSSWNIDTMDGTGPSGITIDFTKTQILVIDYEWLGVGRARMGFNIDGVTYYAHSFNNANNLDEVYMSTPNLPLRYEIDNDGTGAASGLKTICCSVQSEGGEQQLGILRHKDSGSVGSLSSGTTYAMIGIRLKSAYIGLDVFLENLSLLATTTNDQAHWELKLNPTVDGTFTYSGQTNSGVEIATGANTNTVTLGTDIDGGYFSTALPISPTIPNARRLGAAIDGTVDEIVLTCTPITNNITVEASLTWRELL